MTVILVKHGKKAQEANRLFKAIADPSRRRMLALLAHEELPLKRIEAEFAMSRTAVIKHLRILETGKLVVTRRRGRETLHRLNARPLRAVWDWAAHFELLWDESLHKLKLQVEADK